MGKPSGLKPKHINYNREWGGKQKWGAVNNPKRLENRLAFMSCPGQASVNSPPSSGALESIFGFLLQIFRGKIVLTAAEEVDRAGHGHDDQREER
jgi:hypothetical protein